MTCAVFPTCFLSKLQITELLTDVERLKQALNGLSQLAYTSNVPNKRQTQHVDTLQAQIKSLQQQLAVSRRLKASANFFFVCPFSVVPLKKISSVRGTVCCIMCLWRRSNTLPSSSVSGQDAERQHREVVSIYRTHLLSAAQVSFCSVFHTTVSQFLFFTF